MALGGGLHDDVLVWLQLLGRHEVVWKVQFRVELCVDGVVPESSFPELAVLGDGVVLDPFFNLGAVLLQHFSRVAACEDRLDPRGHVACVERDRPGRRDAGQQGVADTVLADSVCDVEW